MKQKAKQQVSRRRFLKTVSAATLIAGTGPAIVIPGRSQPKTLKIAIRKDFTPNYIKWLENYAIDWGHQNNIKATVDWVKQDEQTTIFKNEVIAKQGHDLVASLPQYQNHYINHEDIYQECRQSYGQPHDIANKATYNPKTRHAFAVCPAYIPLPVIYRKDLWGDINMSPSSWDNIRLGGRQIKFYSDHSVGISLGKNEDSNLNLETLLYAFGSSIQDDDNKPILKSKQTFEALRFLKTLHHDAMTNEVLTWNNGTSNNLFMLSGNGSLALNPISITRAGERKNFPITDQLIYAKTPQGPEQRLSTIGGTLRWSIWNFAKNVDAAKQFIIDYIGQSRHAFLSSAFYYFPSFPQTVPDINQLLAYDSNAIPTNKYQVLSDASDWSVMVGYPGYFNAAVKDVYHSGLISKMFAAVVTDKMSPSEAMNQADQEVRKIYDKWRRLGKI